VPQWDREHILEYMMPMVQPSKLLPGFSCPAEVKVGPRSWGATATIGTIRC
jgi:hypothetical protein